MFFKVDRETSALVVRQLADKGGLLCKLNANRQRMSFGRLNTKRETNSSEALGRMYVMYLVVLSSLKKVVTNEPDAVK